MKRITPEGDDMWVRRALRAALMILSLSLSGCADDKSTNDPALPHDLAVSVTGAGQVSSTPVGIACGSDCTEAFAVDSVLTLSATPNSGFTFSGWGGDCSGNASSCELIMNASRVVTATFAASPNFPDTIAPELSNIAVSNITATSATLSWTTDEGSTSVVNYGLTSFYGSSTGDAAHVTRHSVLLSGLSAETTYHYRVSSADAANNVTTGTDGTFATAASGGASGETLTSYANRDLGLYPINAFDESQPTPLFVTGGSTVTYEATANRLGGPDRKFTPPTSDGAYSGYGQFDLNGAGTFGFRRMAIRFEMQIGATYGSNNIRDAVKLLIINMTDTLGGATTTRPMLYLDSRRDEPEMQDNYVMLALAQGTTRRYSASVTSVFPDGTTPFFFGPTATTTLSGRPVVGAAEWVSVSYYMNSQAETGYPNGRLWMKVTRQNGAVLADFSHAYNIDAAANPDDFIAVLDILGGYYNFAANAQEATNFLRIAYPTFQANANAPLEPRTGFVQ